MSPSRKATFAIVPVIRRSSAAILVAVLGSLLAPLPAGAQVAADCPVPGLDDRCEDWVAHHTKTEGEAPFARSSHDVAIGGGLSPAGDVAFAFGNHYDFSSDLRRQLQTVAYDVRTGARRWVAHEPPHQPGWETQARDIVVSPDGTTVYVLGAVADGSAGSEDRRDLLIAAYDATNGQRRWRTVYDGPARRYDDAHALAVSPDGQRVLVAAGLGASALPVREGGPSRDLDFGLLDLDAETGEVQRTTTYAGGTFAIDGTTYASADEPRHIAVSADGKRVALAGVTAGRESYRTDRAHLTVATWERPSEDAGWRLSWARELRGVALGFARVGEDFALTGAAASNATSSNPYATILLDGDDGATRWETRFEMGDRFPIAENPRGLLVDEQRGRILVHGLSPNAGSADGTSGVVMLGAANGQVLWRRPLHDARNDLTLFFDYDRDGSPVAGFDASTGHVLVSANKEARVITYAIDGATGTRRWTAIHDHPVRSGSYLEQSDWNFAAGVEAANGRAVIFGHAYVPRRDTCPNPNPLLPPTPCPKNDFLTIAYEV